jgi:hypothetical protein
MPDAGEASRTVSITLYAVPALPYTKVEEVVEQA